MRPTWSGIAAVHRILHAIPAESPRRKRTQDLRKRIAQAYQNHVDYRRETALRIWFAFILTFIFLRALTYSIKYHLLPVGNVVTKSGLHIHHFVWGILLLILVGFLALALEQARWHPWLAFPFGIGAALVIDEFALWLNLQDLYWSPGGRISIDAAILFAALLGVYYAADRFWRQVVKEIGAVFRLTEGEERRLFRRKRSSSSK